jgi:hypothetical protein
VCWEIRVSGEGDEHDCYSVLQRVFYSLSRAGVLCPRAEGDRSWMTTGRWCGRLPVHGAAAAMCGEEEASPQWRRGCEAQEEGVEWGPTCARAERDDNRSGLDQLE